MYNVYSYFSQKLVAANISSYKEAVKIAKNTTYPVFVAKYHPHVLKPLFRNMGR